MTAPKNAMRALMTANEQEPKSKPAMDDKKFVQRTFRLTPAQAHELRMFCAAENTTLQEAVLAGLNLLLGSKGLPPL